MQLNLLPAPDGALPARVRRFPQLRYMGSKHRLLAWLHGVLGELSFVTALDAFSGSGSVSYLLKAMGKEVTSADFLRFPSEIARATIANDRETLGADEVEALCAPARTRDDFIERTFGGVFYTPEDLRFLDDLWANLSSLAGAEKRALALAAAVRACVKRQPRGVFTVTGDLSRYDDGRRDLRLPLREHFARSVDAYNAAVFENGRRHRALRADVFSLPAEGYDLVYLDPPYVPRADDNCYIKRYHFLEGLVSYWRDEDAQILEHTRARKLAKRYTPFSYRRTAAEAFDALFRRFADSTLVLSYSSNGYPGLDDLKGLMRRYKAHVEVFERAHRYHFGTHGGVDKARATVREYLIVGT